MSMSMQEETRNLLRVDESHRSEAPAPELSVSDHLTSKDGIDFWRRYFSDYTHTEVPIDDFFEAVQSEYATLVFK